MKHTLCFGYSNTYGLIPQTGGRYQWGVRWPSILNEKLGMKDYWVIEEGLCGRTTVFDDPLRDGRCGVKVLPNILETHNPLDLVIIMLGTNDCKTAYSASPELIGKAAARLIGQVRDFSGTSKIILISPIHLGKDVWKSEYDPDFSTASVDVSKKLSGVLRTVSENENVYFLDASSYAEPSETDQEHLNENGHRSLAEAIYKK